MGGECFDAGEPFCDYEVEYECWWEDEACYDACDPSCIGYTGDPCCCYNNCGGGGGGSNPPTGYIEIIRDSTFENTKVECVYEKLEELNGSFRNTIEKLDGQFPVSHLKFSVDQNMTSNTQKAYTVPPQDYVISIVFNGNSVKDASYQKRPNLLVAKTIIHEVTHAEMWRKILSIIDNGGNVGSLTKQQWENKLSSGDYPGIFYYYTQYGINGYQHPQKAAHYRDVIADGLEELDNFSRPRQFYQDLSWEGLIYGNDPTWTSLPLEERTRIQNVIADLIQEKINETCIL